MPGGLVQPNYQIDGQGVMDILQKGQEAALTHQLLQAKVQSEMMQSQAEQVRMQAFQQEMEQNRQLFPSKLKQSEAQTNLMGAEAEKARAGIPLVGAEVSRMQAETGNIQQRTAGEAQGQAQSSALFPSQLDLTQTQAQGATSDLNKKFFENTLSRIQETKKWEDYLQTQKAGSHVLTDVIAQHHPEIDKNWLSLYTPVLEPQAQQNLLHQLDQSKQMDLESLQLQKVLLELPEQQRLQKVGAMLGQLNQSNNPAATASFMAGSPIYQQDKDLAPIAKAANELYSTFGSAKSMENQIAAGLISQDPQVRTAALIMQYAWHNKQLPMRTVEPAFGDFTSTRHTEVDVDALQKADPFLQEMIKRSQSGGKGQQAQPQQQTQPGSSATNPVVFKEQTADTIARFNALPSGTYYVLPSGKTGVK